MKSGVVVKHVTFVLKRDRERKGSDVGRILRIVTRRQEVVMLCVVCEVVPFWMNPIPSTQQSIILLFHSLCVCLFGTSGFMEREGEKKNEVKSGEECVFHAIHLCVVSSV